MNSPDLAAFLSGWTKTRRRSSSQRRFRLAAATLLDRFRTTRLPKVSSYLFQGKIRSVNDAGRGRYSRGRATADTRRRARPVPQRT
jgi:hypothetical protein